MLLISWGTGPFSVGICPWSLCTAAIDKHTHTQHQGCHPSLHWEKGTSCPRQICRCFFFYFICYDETFTLAENHSIQSKRRKGCPLSHSLHGAICKELLKTNLKIPVATWDAGNPCSIRTLNNTDHSLIQFSIQIGCQVSGLSLSILGSKLLNILGNAPCCLHHS